MITVTITLEDGILNNMQPEDVLHPFLLVASREKFKAYLIDAKVL